MQKHVKKVIIFLLIAGFVVYAVIEFDALILLFRSSPKWIYKALRFFRKILIRGLRSIVRRKFLRPLWSALGIVWLIRYLSQKFKGKWMDKITSFFRSVKDFWRDLSWYFRTCIVIGLLAVFLLMGFGLWMIPFGFPFIESVLIKLQIFWANSWLHKLTQRVRNHTVILFRRIKNHPPVLQFRIARIWVVRRDRALSRWADQKFQS